MSSHNPTTLSSIARLCVSLSIMLLAIIVSMQGCAIRELQRRVVAVEGVRR